MKLELIVPTSLSEIPLKHYQEFVSVRNSSTDDQFVAEKMIQIFCGIELKDVVKMKVTSVIDLVNHFNKLFSEKPKLQHRFTFQGTEYGIIPDGLENISFAEYVDLEKAFESWETYHKAMAVLYRPITKTFKDKYEIQEYNSSFEFDELMKFCPLDVALGAHVFFCDLSRELLAVIPRFLENKMSKEMKATLAKELNLQNDGDGISHFINLLTENLQHLTKYQNTDYLNVLIS